MNSLENSSDRQFDMLIAPMSKYFRYPLALPESLGEKILSSQGEGDLRVMKSPSGSPFTGKYSSVGTSQSAKDGGYGDQGFAGDSRERKATAAAIQKERQEFLKEEAMQSCIDKINTYTQWKDQIQKSLQQADKSRQVLVDVLSGVRSMRAVTQTVQEQSSAVTQTQSNMMLQKARLEVLRDEIQKLCNHFTHIDNLCRETQNPLLSASSDRFPKLMEDLEKEQRFLAQSSSFKSTREYSLKLGAARQMTMECLTQSLRNSLEEAARVTRESQSYKNALNPQQISSYSTTKGEADTMKDGIIAEPKPLLDWDNIDHSFSSFIAEVNLFFVTKLNEHVSMRRLLECQRSSSAPLYSVDNGVEFNGGEIDSRTQSVLSTYREVRVKIIGPLLRQWLAMWYNRSAKGAPLTASLIEMGRDQETKSAVTVNSESPDPTNQTLDTEGEEKTATLVPATSSPSSPPMERNMSQTQVSTAGMDSTLPEITSQMCSFLGVCLESEKEMIEEVWLREDFITILLPQLVSSISDEVYHVFRSRLLRVDEIEELTDAIKVIQRMQITNDTSFSSTQDINALWIRMIQDAQERLFFRTSVYLRQKVVSCRPTRANAKAYLSVGNISDSSTAAPAEEWPPCNSSAFYLDGVLNALKLLGFLYPTLEFSVFAVFAEEAIKASLELIEELKKLMQAEKDDGDAAIKALLCQLSHLLFLKEQLSHIDANIMVVESSLDFTKLRQRRLEIVQSKHDSKKVVENEFVTCVDRLTQSMLTGVSQPMTGVASKEVSVKTAGLESSRQVAQRFGQIVPAYIYDTNVISQILEPVNVRVNELAKDVGL